MTSMHSFDPAATSDRICPLLAPYDKPIPPVGIGHPSERHKIRKVLFPELAEPSTPVVPRPILPQGGRPDEANEA